LNEAVEKEISAVHERLNVLFDQPGARNFVLQHEPTKSQYAVFSVDANKTRLNRIPARSSLHGPYLWLLQTPDRKLVSSWANRKQESCTEFLLNHDGTLQFVGHYKPGAEDSTRLDLTKEKDRREWLNHYRKRISRFADVMNGAVNPVMPPDFGYL
jgi:hypothetical protein